MAFLKPIAFMLACTTIGNAQDLNLNDIDMRKMVFDMNRKIDSLDKRVELLEERHKLLETIEKLVQGSGETPQIAFTVSVSTKQIENLGKHQTIVFDHVITNVGSMYNPLTGIFHVPYSGTYVLSLTFNPGKLTESDTYLEIVQNGAQLADVLVETELEILLATI
ncbi:EMILIN-1-like [Mya arenaria]|uniref:EMILIN-1-like n=1 Tax=Mya arenaria TaxID=6604 RepID=UPI0022E13445|nr:EMILIN-1-like [Mya arenaria]